MRRRTCGQHGGNIWQKPQGECMNSGEHAQACSTQAHSFIRYKNSTCSTTGYAPLQPSYVAQPLPQSHTFHQYFTQRKGAYMLLSFETTNSKREANINIRP